MENKINIARFKEGSRTAEVRDIWQWDYGQILRIQGLNLPTAVEIHFSLDEHGGEAARRIGVTKDGVTDVPIPDSMVENESAYGDSYYFFAYIYLADEESGNTEYKIRAKVSTRSKPEGFVSGGNDITITELASGTIPSGTEKVFTHTGITFGQLNNYKRIAIVVNGTANSGSDWVITHNEDGTSWKMITLTTQRGYLELHKVAEHMWDVLFKTSANVSNGFSSDSYAPYLTVNSGNIAGTFMLNFTLTQNDEICIYNKSMTTADVNWIIQGMNF